MAAAFPLIVTAACSLLAPSSDDLSGAFERDPLVDSAVTTDASAGGCPLGTKACNGACVSTSAPATGCATASCAPCRGPHGASLCIDGACALGPCENGWANCNGRADDGCEVDTASSSQFCGSCLTSCGAATPRCEQGSCVPRCAAVRLTSTSARVSFPTVGMGVGAGDFTAELWLAWHTAFATGQGSVFTSNEVLEASAIVLIEGDGKINCAATEPVPNGGGAVAAPFPEDGKFHHVACVRGAGVLSIYVDGVRRAQAANTNPIVAGGTAALGRPSGYPDYLAPSMNVGPVRISRVARYDGPFAPRAFWVVDPDTVAQYLTSRGFDGTTLHDEAGGDNDGTASANIVATTETPCP